MHSLLRMLLYTYKAREGRYAYIIPKKGNKTTYDYVNSNSQDKNDKGEINSAYVHDIHKI